MTPDVRDKMRKGSLSMALTIGRYTLIEALRSRVIVLVAFVLAAAAALAVFLRLVAITEVEQVQAAIIAALERLCAVFLLTTLVVSGVRREYDDRVVELILAHALPRASYVLGKGLGYGVLALCFAVAFGAPLLLFAPPLPVAAWTASLAGELCIVVTAALFSALSLRSVPAALAAVAGFYALGRSIDAMLIIASASPESTAWRDVAARWVSEALGLIVPHLDRMTESAWLAGPVLEAHAVLAALVQSAVYSLLLLAASFFDFQRQSF
jgi:hypothetical protein